MSRSPLRDPSLPHQIVLSFVSGRGQISVSCNCRRLPGGSHAPLAVRTRWDAPDAQAAYQAHLGSD